MAHRHRVARRATGGRTVYSGAGSNAAKESESTQDGFARGGKKRKSGGRVDEHKSRKRLDRRARGGGVGGGHSPFSTASKMGPAPMGRTNMRADGGKVDESVHVHHHRHKHGGRTHKKDGGAAFKRGGAAKNDDVTGDDDEQEDEEEGHARGGTTRFRVPSGGVSEHGREQARKHGDAMPGGRFPIRNRSDLSNAKHAFGRAKDKPAVRRWIDKRARDLGASPLGGGVGKRKG